MRQPFEDKIFADQEKMEKEALRLYAISPRKAKAYLTAYCRGPDGKSAAAVYRHPQPADHRFHQQPRMKSEYRR